jgi:hypothetical protein
MGQNLPLAMWAALGAARSRQGESKEVGGVQGQSGRPRGAIGCMSFGGLG